jgi:hypothetical protein
MSAALIVDVVIAYICKISTQTEIVQSREVAFAEAKAAVMAQSIADCISISLLSNTLSSAIYLVSSSFRSIYLIRRFNRPVDIL